MHAMNATNIVLQGDSKTKVPRTGGTIDTLLPYEIIVHIAVVSQNIIIVTSVQAVITCIEKLCVAEY